jgi:CCR4-NOT transcription complex subunit 1
LYSNIAAFITFNPNIPLFTTQPALKRIVHIAIDRAIREVIMSPVVERSVTIASITSREMISKDFALEGSDEKMRKAAHLMAQSLAGNLAAVSTREPLRVSMIAHLKSLLLQNGFSDQAVPEQIVFVIVSDNLDLACSVMEKTAAEKSITEIDESLSAAYLSRRKHRERSTQPFYDMAVFGASRYPSLLPESLRLRVGGLSPQQVYISFLNTSQFYSNSLCVQMRVYEDFISRAISPSAGVYYFVTASSSGLMLLRFGTNAAAATIGAS